MTITPQEALTRCIDHREIFHDEMLALMRMIMRGELSPAITAALLMGLRVKKETIGEISAAAQVMREFANPFWMTALSVVAASVIIGLNLYLVWERLGALVTISILAAVALFATWVRFGYKERGKA